MKSFYNRLQPAGSLVPGVVVLGDCAWLLCFATPTPIAADNPVKAEVSRSDIAVSNGSVDGYPRPVDNFPKMWIVNLVLVNDKSPA